MQPQKLPEFKRLVDDAQNLFRDEKYVPGSFKSRFFGGRGKNPTFNFREALQWVYKSLRNQVHDHHCEISVGV